jgi:hypothetical protein
MDDNDSPTSYKQRAIKEDGGYTYFDLGENGWNEAFYIVKDNDEMWKINKQFIDKQNALGKEFYFSHDPDEATGFMFREVNYIKQELKTKRIEKIKDNLWIVMW